MNTQERKIAEINLAKAVLRENGYFVDNLWCIDDVKSNYVCDDEVAHDILYRALTIDATYEQIWLSIDIVAEDKQLNKIEQ
jgi:hypothetical protein